MKIMTFKGNEIKEKIAVQLENKLTKDGFIYKKTMNEFLCKKDDYKYMFILEQLSWGDHYSIDVRLAISQKQIETILEKIIGKLRFKYTFWQDLARIYKSPDGRQIVNGNLAILLIQDEDITAAVETLEGYYENIAKPYFKRYDSLEAIDDIINNPPFEYCPADVGSGFDDRCMKGLIVARLVNNPKYDELVTIYDEEIKGTMNEEAIENYYKVRDYLMHNRIN
jgi:hypothetical protein